MWVNEGPGDCLFMGSADTDNTETDTILQCIVWENVEK